MDGCGGDRTDRSESKRLALSRRYFLQATAGVGFASVAGVNNLRPVRASKPGEVRWSYSADDRISFSSPTVRDGTVYIGSRDNRVYALDTADGSPVWTFETGNEVRHSSPTVVNGTVYVGSMDNRVYALDMEDGSQVWAFETDDEIRQSSPTVEEGIVYVGSLDSTVYALDATDGSVEWTVQTGDEIRSSPTVVDDTVYVGSDDHSVYALNAADGTRRWVFETNGDVRSSATVVDGVVYIGSHDTHVYALNAEDGSQEWAFETGKRVESVPTVVDGTVYVGSFDNRVYALDTEDGSQKWAFETGGAVRSSPTVARGTVYTGSDDNNFYALAVTDGTQKWAVQTSGSIQSSPTVVDGTVYVGSLDNNIYALQTDHGRSSEDSRILLGTKGHHHEWNGDSDDTNLATFALAITETTDPVQEGDTLEVNASVENTGYEADTQTITLDIDGQEIDSTEVELDGGQSRAITLDWTTEGGDAGSYQAVVESEDDSDETDVTVAEPAAFTVDIVETTEPVVEGDTLEVSVESENTGGVSDTQTLRLLVDGEEVASTEKTLESGETDTERLEWNTDEGDADSYELTVESDDDSDQRDITVHDSAGFLVAITDTNAPVEAGDTLEVDVQVQNTRTVDDTQNIALEINGDQHDSNTLTLDSGESQQLTLDWTAENRNGVGVRVASEDDVDNSHVSLTPEADKTGESAIEILDANTPVSEGDTLEVDVEITNTGDEELTQDIDFDVDGGREETHEVTIGAGESTVETFTWTVDNRASVGVRAASADDWDNSLLLLADTDFMPTGF